ncbi:hypothetical protein [Actinomyces lilanjuaniae]|nr:hypothetical protein [Actinomyces lilanjuaniae]
MATFVAAATLFTDTLLRELAVPALFLYPAVVLSAAVLALLGGVALTRLPALQPATAAAGDSGVVDPVVAGGRHA